jgi:threonine aldolase
MSGEKFIDLRSDTVTQPTAEMRKAMFEAVVGDDVFGEDPTINALHEKAARLLGKEAALFVASGTMGNQLSIKAHTQPGDEVIIAAGGHAMNFEGGASAVLSGVQFAVIPADRGIFDAAQVEAAIRPDDVHFPVTRLVVIENTHNRGGGTVFPLSKIREIRRLADLRGLRLHMDGARLWNACIASGISPAEYAAPFDSLSVCLSKALGCPAGSIVAGSRDFIRRVHRFRKMVGGGMRQIGFLAAAGIYALDHHINRLEEDHQKAQKLARGLSVIPNLKIKPEEVETNILFFDVSPSERTAQEIALACRQKGVLLHPTAKTHIRCVTHLDVSSAEIDQALQVIAKVMKG